MHKPAFTKTPLAAGVAFALGVSATTPVVAQESGGGEVIEEISRIYGPVLAGQDIIQHITGIIDYYFVCRILF